MATRSPGRGRRPVTRTRKRREGRLARTRTSQRGLRVPSLCSWRSLGRRSRRNTLTTRKCPLLAKLVATTGNPCLRPRRLHMSIRRPSGRQNTRRAWYYTTRSSLRKWKQRVLTSLSLRWMMKKMEKEMERKKRMRSKIGSNVICGRALFFSF